MSQRIKIIIGTGYDWGNTRSLGEDTPSSSIILHFLYKLEECEKENTTALRSRSSFLNLTLLCLYTRLRNHTVTPEQTPTLRGHIPESSQHTPHPRVYRRFQPKQAAPVNVNTKKNRPAESRPGRTTWCGRVMQVHQGEKRVLYTLYVHFTDEMRLVVVGGASCVQRVFQTSGERWFRGYGISCWTVSRAARERRTCVT